MVETDKIQFEGLDGSPAIKWGVISGVFFAILSFFLRGDTSIYSDPGYLFGYGLPAYVTLLYFVNWAVHIAIAIYAITIARKLNRSPVIWGIFSFFLPPITLIVLGFQDYKIKDKVIKGIVDKARLDFSAEILDIKNTRDLTPDELAGIEIKLKEKYSKKMKRSIRDSLSDRDIDSGYSPGQATDDDQPVADVNDEGSEIFENEEVLLSEINKCPACGAGITDKTAICPDCGLTLK